MEYKNKKTGSRGTAYVTSRLVLKSPFLSLPAWRFRKHFLKRRFRFGEGMNRHALIVGESGSGKSNACLSIISYLHSEGCRIMALDPNGDYLSIADIIGADVYDASRRPINIMETWAEGRQAEDEISLMLSKRLRLGYIQSSLLRRCIGYCYWAGRMRGRKPTFDDLIATANAFRKKAPQGESRILDTILGRLYLISSGSQAWAVDFQKAVSRNSIFVLSELRSEESQSVYMEGLLRKLYAAMLSGRLHRPTCLVIDEARKVAGSPALGRLFAEGRKYGLGIITVSQRASNLDENVLSNSSLLLAFYQREPREMEYISRYISGGSEMGRIAEVRRRIRNLRKGEAVALDSQAGEPFTLMFSRFNGNATSLEHLIGKVSLSGSTEPSIYNHALRAGFSHAETKARLECLLAEGRIGKHEIRSGRLRGTWYVSYFRNSPEHDLFVRLISKKLTLLGIENEVGNGSRGPDVIANISGKSVAIEYETGSKNPEDTIRMIESRVRSYGTVIVVAPEAVLGRYKSINGVSCISDTEAFE